MEDIYQINPKLDIPIYQQLVDTIRNAVKKGILVPNQQLPTVSELSEKLGIARGTIKRAYDDSSDYHIPYISQHHHCDNEQRGMNWNVLVL